MSKEYTFIYNYVDQQDQSGQATFNCCFSKLVVEPRDIEFYNKRIKADTGHKTVTVISAKPSGS